MASLPLDCQGKHCIGGWVDWFGSIRCGRFDPWLVGDKSLPQLGAKPPLLISQELKCTHEVVHAVIVVCDTD
jgi:hypothetical protein